MGLIASETQEYHVELIPEGVHQAVCYSVLDMGIQENINFGNEKREVMRTYGSLGEESFEFLEAIIDGQLSHMDENTRAVAVYGIAMIQSDETLRFLRSLISEERGPVKYAASEALATLVP